MNIEFWAVLGLFIICIIGIEYYHYRANKKKGVDSMEEYYKDLGRM